MKQIFDRPDQYALLDIADALGRKEGVDIADEADLDGLLQELVRSAQAIRSNPAALHGRRVEAMFGYVAAALGTARLIKREDCGDVFTSDQEQLTRPDYRVVAGDGRQLLIEVKNCHTDNPQKGLRLRVRDWTRLQRYAELFETELRLAVYWSQWRVWTLVSPTALSSRGARLHLSFLDALQYNEMRLLGDFYLGTNPPLRIRILTDPTQPRRIGEAGHVNFVIGGVELFAANTQVTAPRERDLLTYLFMWGNWRECEPAVEVEDGELIAIEFRTAPEEITPYQGFEMIGPMSSMIARVYNQLTTTDQTVRRLTPRIGADRLGRSAPGRVAELTFPLWVFYVNPSNREAPGA